MFYSHTIKEYITEYVDWDTDYWFSGSGSDYIIARLKTFSDQNWKNLYNDLINWNLNEIEILAIVLSGNKYEDKQSNSFFKKCCQLFINIFITTEVNLAIDILGDIEFILKCDNLELHNYEKIIYRINELKKQPGFELFHTQKKIKELKLKIEHKKGKQI